VFAFVFVCALSGLAFGADLAVPSALLAGQIAHNGDKGQREGAYFGWWNLAGKLNLALAAGLALPLLQWLGYQSGGGAVPEIQAQAHEQGLRALTLAYAVLPCALKLLAAVLLYTLLLRPRPAVGAAADRPHSPHTP
jgi:Na+/melibiose symporter-like transporter